MLQPVQLRLRLRGGNSRFETRQAGIVEVADTFLQLLFGEGKRYQRRRISMIVPCTRSLQLRVSELGR